MTTYFDDTALSPTQTSLVTADYFKTLAARRGGYSYLEWSLDTNGDYSAVVFGKSSIVASSRAAIHGGTDGVWYFKDFLTWTAASASTADAAKTQAEDVLIKQALNRAASIIGSLTELCGTPPPIRTKYNTGTVTADSINSRFTAPAADNAFLWADESMDGLVSFTGFANADNNTYFSVVSLDVSADPHVLTVAEAPADETAVVSVTLTYEPGLPFPRDWTLYLGSEIGEQRAAIMPPSNITPKAVRDANAILAWNLLRGDRFNEADGDTALEQLPVKSVEIFEAVKLAFDTGVYANANTKAYLSDEVLNLLSPYLCVAIRGYGKNVTVMGDIGVEQHSDGWW